MSVTAELSSPLSMHFSVQTLSNEFLNFPALHFMLEISGMTWFYGKNSTILETGGFFEAE